MSIRGGRLPSICSQFQTFLNSLRGGGGQNFSIISEIQNILNYPRGGGASLIGNFSQIFPFFLVTPPLRKFEYVISPRYLGNIRQLKWYIFENSNIKDTWNILDIWNRTEISKRSKKLGQVRIGQDRSGWVRAGQYRTRQVWTRKDKSEPYLITWPKLRTRRYLVPSCHAGYDMTTVRYTWER